MVIELCVVQFWSQIILVISNRTRTARSFDFEITRMISDQIALHSVQLPLLSYNVTCAKYQQEIDLLTTNITFYEETQIINKKGLIKNN